MRIWGSRAVRRAGAFVAAGLLMMMATAPVWGASDPVPDPAGIATGDKTNVVDAGGNAFVVAEPDRYDPRRTTRTRRKRSTNTRQMAERNRWR